MTLYLKKFKGEAMTGKEHKCNVNQDGICGVHNITVERRDMKFSQMEREIRHIPKLLTLANRALGAFGFASLIFTALTIYIRDVRQEHIMDNNRHQAEIQQVSKDVQALTVQAAKNEGKYLMTLQQMGNLSRVMEKILDRDET